MGTFYFNLLTALYSLSLAQKYIFVDQVMTVNDAEAYCDSTYGTTLASIHNDTDKIDAQVLCQPQASDTRQVCSIGLKRGNNSNGWVWSDGSAFDYMNWNPGEPNNWQQNGFSGEDCAVIQTDGLMNDVPCDGPQNNTSGYFQRALCNYPTSTPTTVPTLGRSSKSPTNNPTQSPTNNPTISPSNNPSKYPTFNPSISPSQKPTRNPTKSTILPTLNPVLNPTTPPSANPTVNPTTDPTFHEDAVHDIITTDHLIANDLSEYNKQNDNSSLLTLVILISIIALFLATFIFLFIFCKRQKEKYKQNVEILSITSTHQEEEIISPNPMSMIANTITPKETSLGIAHGDNININEIVLQNVNENTDNNVNIIYEIERGENINAEGLTKRESNMSAVHLDIINDNNVTDNGYNDNNVEQNNVSVDKMDEMLNQPNKQSDSDDNSYDLAKEEQNNENNVIPGTDAGSNNNVEQNENVLLDGMLSDVLRMKSLDPNKIHQINKGKIETDSDDSDNMYDHEQ